MDGGDSRLHEDIGPLTAVVHSNLALKASALRKILALSDSGAGPLQVAPISCANDDAPLNMSSILPRFTEETFHFVISPLLNFEAPPNISRISVTEETSNLERS